MLPPRPPARHSGVALASQVARLLGTSQSHSVPMRLSSANRPPAAIQLLVVRDPNILDSWFSPLGGSVLTIRVETLLYRAYRRSAPLWRRQPHSQLLKGGCNSQDDPEIPGYERNTHDKARGESAPAHPSGQHSSSCWPRLWLGDRGSNVQNRRARQARLRFAQPFEGFAPVAQGCPSNNSNDISHVHPEEPITAMICRATICCILFRHLRQRISSQS